MIVDQYSNDPSFTVGFVRGQPPQGPPGPHFYQQQQPHQGHYQPGRPGPGGYQQHMPPPPQPQQAPPPPQQQAPPPPGANEAEETK